MSGPKVQQMCMPMEGCITPSVAHRFYGYKETALCPWCLLLRIAQRLEAQAKVLAPLPETRHGAAGDRRRRARWRGERDMSDRRSPDGPNGEKPTFWGQYATRLDPLEMQSGVGHYDFYAYDKNRNVVVATWTSAPMTFIVEREVYQKRLDDPKDDIIEVSVTRRDNQRDFNPLSLNAREPGRWLMVPNAIAGAVR